MERAHIGEDVKMGTTESRARARRDARVAAEKRKERRNRNPPKLHPHLHSIAKRNSNLQKAEGGILLLAEKTRKGKNSTNG